MHCRAFSFFLHSARFLRFILVALWVSNLLLLLAAECSMIFRSSLGAYDMPGLVCGALRVLSLLILPTTQEQGTVIAAGIPN